VCSSDLSPGLHRPDALPLAGGFTRVSSDSLGFFQLPLIRGVRVRLQIPDIGYDKRVLVPAASSADFTTL
jgi:hypothetical protein